MYFFPRIVLKKKVLTTGTILCVVLAILGLFYETIDNALYETINGKPLLTRTNLVKLGKLSKEKPQALERYNLNLSNHGNTTFISYWNRVEGFTVHRTKDGMYNFTFSIAEDSDIGLRRNNSFNQKDANRVVDHIVGRKQKERVLATLEELP